MLFSKHLARGTALLSAGLLMSLPILPAQEFTEPVPSTPEPGGGIVPPANADGVVPAEDGGRPARPDVLPGVDPDRPVRATRQSTPMTAEDLQTWQQIATLHERFVRSHVPGAADSPDISRTDPNRERLRRLWERLAEIERQLIVTGAFNESPEAVAVTTRRITRPLPGRDLDEVPDPLTTSNQTVRSSENDRDQSTARALAEEDRSPVPGPDTPSEVVRDGRPGNVTQVETVTPAGREAARVAAPSDDETPGAGTGNLWQEFVEIRRQILIAEITAAQAIVNE